MYKGDRRFYTIFVCTVFAVVIITNIIQAFYTVNKYEKRSLENYYAYAGNSIEQFNTSVDETIGMAKMLAVKISADTEINDVVRSGKAGITSEKMEDIKEWMLIVPKIVDITFFNPDMDKVFSIKGGYMSYDSYWEGMTEQTLKDLEMQWLVLRKSQHIVNAEDLLSVCFSSNVYYDSYVIIDISFDEVRHEFKKYAKEEDCELLVASKSQLLFASDEKVFSDKSLMESVDKKGTVISVDGEKYGAIALNSDSFGLNYTVLTEYDKIRENYIMESQLRFILVYVLILIAGLGILYFSMKRSYRPVSKIISEYRKMKSSDAENKVKKQLMEFITVPVVSEKMALSVQELAESKLGDAKSFQLVMVIIDNYAEFLNGYTATERSAYKYAIENICMEVICEKHKCVAFENDESCKIFLVSGTEDGDVSEVLAVCREYVQKHLELSVSIIISDKYGFDSLYDAYSELVLLKNYRVVYPGGAIIKQTEIDETAEEEEKYVAQINADISEGEFGRVPELFDAYIARLQKKDPNEITGRLINFFSAVYGVIANQSWASAEGSLHATMKSIIEAENVTEVKNEFMRLIKEAEQAKDEFSSNKYQAVAENIYKCIENSWTDPLFCVETIAKKLKYSSVYLSRIFKYVTGESLAAVIMQKRVEESAKLLRESDIPIKDIFEQCGFSSNSYFSILFKKQYGVTPSEYRRSFKEE